MLLVQQRKVILLVSSLVMPTITFSTFFNSYVRCIFFVFTDGVLDFARYASLTHLQSISIWLIIMTNKYEFSCFMLLL